MSGAGQEEDKKPADQAAHINLKVKGQVRVLSIDLFFSFCFLLLLMVSLFLVLLH